MGDGGLVAFIIILVMVVSVFLVWWFMYRKKEGKKCTPSKDEKVSDADTYAYDANGNCVVANCLADYSLLDNVCTKKVETPAPEPEEDNKKLLDEIKKLKEAIADIQATPGPQGEPGTPGTTLDAETLALIRRLAGNSSVNVELDSLLDLIANTAFDNGRIIHTQAARIDTLREEIMSASDDTIRSSKINQILAILFPAVPVAPGGGGGSVAPSVPVTDDTDMLPLKYGDYIYSTESICRRSDGNITSITGNDCTSRIFVVAPILLEDRYSPITSSTKVFILSTPDFKFTKLTAPNVATETTETLDYADSPFNDSYAGETWDSYTYTIEMNESDFIILRNSRFTYTIDYPEIRSHATTLFDTLPTISGFTTGKLNSYCSIGLGGPLDIVTYPRTAEECVSRCGGMNTCDSVTFTAAKDNDPGTCHILQDQSTMNDNNYLTGSNLGGVCFKKNN
jgi:hypothetical protein